MCPSLMVPENPGEQSSASECSELHICDPASMSPLYLWPLRPHSVPLLRLQVRDYF